MMLQTSLLRAMVIIATLLTGNCLNAQIVYVTPSGAGTKDGSSWVHALDGNTPATGGFTRLADTLRHAVSGTAFWVAEGTYKACTDNDRAKSFEIPQNISVFGGFAGTETTVIQRIISDHPTIFTGDIGVPGDSTDNTKVIMRTISTPWTQYSTVDGLNLVNTYNNLANTISPGLWNSALLNVLNCTLKNNYSNGSGGGIYNSGKINIRNCLFFNNRASNGAGVYNEYSSGPTQLVTALLASCRFSNNSAAHNGGGICNSGVGTINNCLVVNNAAVNGGGIYIGSSANANFINTKIINSTVANNSGSNVYFYKGISSLWNSVSWGSTVYFSSYVTPDFKYSCIQGTASGVGVVNLDPLFVNPTQVIGNTVNGLNANWHTRWCSPCFNVASNPLVLAGDTLDLDGQQRIRYGSVDMGCYEVDTTNLFQNSINYSGGIVHVDTGTTYKGGGSTWAQAVGGNVESCKYPGRNMLYEGLKDAPSGTQIWVTAGTFTTSLWNNRTHSYTIGTGVKLFGGFDGDETTISDRGNGLTLFSGNIGISGISTDNAYHVFNINSSNVAFNDTALIDNVVISGGYADGSNETQRGAGMLIGQNTKLQMSGVTITGNTAYAAGGGIYSDLNSYLQLSGCRIDSNKMFQRYDGNNNPMSGNGAGLYNKGMVKSLNSSFSYNAPGDLGAGIYNAGSAELDSCRADSNTCTGYMSKGGGLYNAANLLINNSFIRWNKAKYDGGGISNAPGAVANLSGSDISNNQVMTSGGGGVDNKGQLMMENCILENNMGGGVVNSATTALATVSFSSLNFNTINGGALNQGIMHILNCKICNNIGTQNGNGLNNPTSVKNSLVANNGTSQATLGGIWLSPGCEGIQGCTVVNNTGPGIASTAVVGQTFPVKNTIVFGNTSSLTDSYTVSNSCIENGYNGSQNIPDNPVFVNPTPGKGNTFNAVTSTWSLDPCSPCVDKGSNGFLQPPDTLDLDGNPRVFNSFVDIGSCELQSPPLNQVDYSTGFVRVCDSVSGNGNGTSWLNSTPGNSPSCRYPGFTMLYETFRDAPPGCEVWIKKGMYKPCTDDDRNKSFLLGEGKRIYGGFSGNEMLAQQRNIPANPTILSGNIGSEADSLDNSYHVIYTLPALTTWNDTTLLNGITIQEGTANYSCSQCLDERLVGGGLLLNTNTKFLLTDCMVRKNSGNGNYSNSPTNIGRLGGGGIYNKGLLLMENSSIVSNANYRMGGGIFTESRLEMRRCTIDSNFVSFDGSSYFHPMGGAGVYNYFTGTVMIDSCNISGNGVNENPLTGGGIKNRGQMSISNSTFTGNAPSAVHNEGPASVFNCYIINNENGYISSQTVSTITNCTITGNKGPNDKGVGISSGGVTTISGCDVGLNANGIRTGGVAKIYNTRIHDNDNKGFYYQQGSGWFGFVYVITTRIGSGLLHDGDSLIVDNCIINNNNSAGGSGVYLMSGYGSINRSYIHHNSGDAGSAFKNHDRLYVSNSLICNNVAHRFGIFCNVDTSQFVIKNSTVANNLINTAFSGRIFMHGTHYDDDGVSSFDLKNCIVQSAYSPLFSYYDGNTGSDSVAYSCVSGGFPGTGNINADPMFVFPVPENDTILNPADGGFRLSACSPCVNAGADSLCTGSLDLDGNQRKYNTIDMGAYELKYDSSIINVWHTNTTLSSSDILWKSRIKPCHTVVFIKDTITGAPVPNPDSVYTPNPVFGMGSNLDGWHCIYMGMDSTVAVTGLTGSTNYRVAVFNFVLGSQYDVPGLMNFYATNIPELTQVASDTVTNGQTLCFNATQTITVAGNGSRFLVEDGGMVTLIAGQRISLLPGTDVESGGYMLGYITSDNNYCNALPNPLVANLNHGELTAISGSVKPVSKTFFRIYPNPTTGPLTIEPVGFHDTETMFIEIFNSMGKRVLRMVSPGGSQTLTLDDLPQGIYLVRVTIGQQNAEARIIKIQ